MMDRFDHIVLTVASLEASLAFYTTVMGMEEVAFGNGRKAVVFGRQKINLHPVHELHPPVAANPLPGSADLCLISAIPLETFCRHLDAHGVDLVEGPVQRTGAMGNMMSVYFRDPDGNLIEVSSYV